MSKSGRPAMRLASISVFVSLLSLLACSAQAQVMPASRGDGQASLDADAWSEWHRPSMPLSVDVPLSDEAFAAVAKGGPWSQADWQPLSSVERKVMNQARAGQWADVLASLAADDPRPDARDRDGATLLTLAARQARLDVVRELLRRGADPDVRGWAGLTPLAAASVAGNDLVVQTLLRSGADVTRWSANGQSALHLAAQGGQVKVMRTLMAAHADPLAWNRGGRAALHEAAAAGNVAAMSMLVDAGVPVASLDEHGLNALHAAALGRHFAAVDWLQTRGVASPHVLTKVLLEQLADPAPVLP